MSLVGTIFVLSTIDLYKLNMHLGKPHRFYRGFNNLRLSPVSREIAGVSMFYTGLLGYAFFALFDTPMLSMTADLFAYLAVISGPVGLYFMYKLYRIPARPFWDHLQTGTAFLGSMLSLGALIIAAVSLILLPLSSMAGLIQTLAMLITAGLLIESIGHLIHARDMQVIENEGAASYYRQTTQYGKSYLLRNGLLAFSLVLATSIAYTGLAGVQGLVLAGILVITMMIMAAFGRSLFFVLVIPTTMPGAFFWKNDGFVDHARETGLAEAEQVGVVYERHHAFKVVELMQTIKENSIKDMFAHVLWIFGKK
jgi:DMSO reductase anchor subunit